MLQKHIHSKSSGQLGHEFLSLGKQLRRLLQGDAGEIVTSIVDQALQWVVRLFSGIIDESVDDLIFIDELSAFIYFWAITIGT